MPSIGNFGERHVDLDLNFGWCGEATIRVHPQASDIGFTEFMARAHDVQLPDDVEDMTPAQMAEVLNSMTAVTTAIWKLMKDLIHPDDWDEFWRLAKKNGQQNSDLIQLSRDIQAAVGEALSGFPTGQRSGSADTPSSTRPRSSATGSSRRERRAAARQHLGARSRQEKVRERAMAELSGRPDLKVALLRSQPEEALGSTG